jgi:hypothetical protein
MFTLKTGVIGLLSMMMAVSAYAYTADSVLQFVVGGIDTPDPCKNPCVNGSVEVKECSDPCNRVTPGGRACLPAEFATYVDGGGVVRTTPCNKNFCAINTLWNFACVSGAPGSGETKCAYKIDGTQNGRLVSHRQIAGGGTCATTGPGAGNYPTCTYNNIRDRATGVDALYGGWTTPCIVASCGGVEVISSPYPGRGVCN